MLYGQLFVLCCVCVLVDVFLMRLCVLRVIYWAMRYILFCLSDWCCVRFENCLCVVFVIYCVLLYDSVCLCLCVGLGVQRACAFCL